MAIRQSNVGRRKADVLTAAQTGYNARDRLAGRLDDATVRQAVEATSISDGGPSPALPLLTRAYVEVDR